MRIAVACDHAGLAFKELVLAILKEAGHEILDLGAHEYDAHDDYPDFARYIAQAIQHGQAERGILLCGSGVGASIAAGKHKGVRASVCHDVYSAHQGVEHDDMNVMCLGSRVIGSALVPDLVNAFINARFLPEDRFIRRLDKVRAIEKAN